MNLKISQLSKHPELYQEVVNLIEESFGYNSEYSFDIDFYPLVNKSNWSHCYLLFDSEKLIGHIGVLEKTILFPNQKTSSAAFIGGIAISSSHQGRGLFRDFFEKVLRKVEASVSYIILWSEKSELYQKFSFDQFGRTVQTGNYPFKRPKDFKQVSLRELGHHDIDHLSMLYNNCYTDIPHIQRGKDDWETISKITSTSLFIRRDSEGKVSHYFFQGKGQDLTEIIHEIGCIYEDRDEYIRELSPCPLWLPEEIIPENLEVSGPVFYTGIVKSMKGEAINGLFISGLDSI